MKPILAHVYEPRLVSFPCYVQPKFNGVRALYQNGMFQSRDEFPWNSDLLDHLAKPLLELFGPDVVLDGELYRHGWPLQRINGAIAVNRRERNEDTLQIDYIIYDQVKYNVPFIERFNEISELLNWHIPVAGLGAPRAATTLLAKSVKDVDSFYAMCVNEKFEGIMYRLGECPYTYPKQSHSPLIGNQLSRARALSDKNNRTWHLLKRKDWQDGEFKITGVIEGEGKRQHMTGALQLSTHDNQTFFCGTGFTESQAEAWFQHPETIIGRFAKIQFLVYSDAGIPMNNSLIHII